MYDYDELVQRIKNNKSVLLYLRLCYMGDVDEDAFREKLQDCCRKCGVRENEAYAMYYATRLLDDPCREEVMREIERTEARQQT